MFNLTRKGLWAHKVRFLLTGDHSSGSVAAFELVIPAGQPMTAGFDDLFSRPTPDRRRRP
jgi:hypothetical protein